MAMPSLRDGREEFGEERSVRSWREFCRVSADVSSASVALEATFNNNIGRAGAHIRFWVQQQQKKKKKRI